MIDRLSMWRADALPVAALGVSGIVAGALVTRAPGAAALALVLVVAVALALQNRRRLESGVAALLFGGAMILGYGFANIGFRTPVVPLPLTEILMLPLAFLALGDARTRPRAVLLPLGLYVGWVIVRLVADFGQFGSLAVRDSTTAIESLTMLVGYRVVRQDGVDAWAKRTGWLFVGVIAYGALFPWMDALSQIGPTVGLQRDVDLLGHVPAFPAAVGLLFFATMWRGAGRWLAITVAVVIVGVAQLRGLYVVLPLAVVALGWAMRRSVRVAAGGAVVVMIGFFLLSWVATQGIQGRVGPIETDFYTSHFATLLGQEGPAAGTLHDRLEWAEQTIDEVTSSPSNLMFGLGLGPDLTFGFRLGGDVDVRKPHDDYLEVLARTGLLGLVLFLWMLARALGPIIKAARAGDEHTHRFCAWILAASVVFLGIAATQPLLGFPYGTVPLFFWIGMGLAAAEALKEESLAHGASG